MSILPKGWDYQRCTSNSTTISRLWQATKLPLSFLVCKPHQWPWAKDDIIQPGAQIKLLQLEESELVSGDSEAIRKFSDKYIVPEMLVAAYADHVAQIKVPKEKKKEETERERMERLNREYNDIDWVGLYNSDKLSSLRVDGLSLYFSHHKITFKGKKAEKVTMIKAHIGMLLYDSMECQQPRQPPKCVRNVL